MELKYNLNWKILLFVGILFGCSDVDLQSVDKTVKQNFKSDLRSTLSRHELDSTIRSEKSVIHDVPMKHPSIQKSFATSELSTNYALQAVVSAESTFPGYSVLKIKDGSRITTVGPADSWSNNYPGGGTLPESVFLKFNALRSVNRIDIYTSTGYILRNYTIQYRTTPTANWITLATVVGNTAVYRMHTFTAVQLLEVQIICQLGPTNQSIYGRLNEVEIYGDVEPTLPPITMVNGMMSFASNADVESTIDYLEYKYDQYDDAFLSQYPGLTDDQYDVLEESINYNDDLPYISFESQYGILSKRAQITANEDSWLESTNGDSVDLDPDNSFVPDDELRTIVNIYGELKIGTKLYHFNDDGTYYEVSAQYLTEFMALRTLKKNQPLPDHVVVRSLVNSENAESCKAGKRSVGYQKNGGWRYKHVTSIWNFPWGGRLIGKTKSYKKKNGHWRKRRATIGVQVMGDVVNHVCDGAAHIDSPYREKRRRKVKVKGKSQIFIKTHSGDVYSYHYSSKVNSFTAFLTF